ncbi:MAG: hypothetical protein HY403_01775 [Elusimicrobia bacterium]|nr:hypothetical protein [Elusimicrobiota bacterium]
MNQAKTEALKALDHIRQRLADGLALDGLDRARLRATAEYAIEQVQAIQEVKRVRRQPDKVVPVSVVPVSVVSEADEVPF